MEDSANSQKKIANSDLTPFAQLLTQRRRAEGLTYRQLSVATGIAIGTLHKFEQGHAQMPSPTLLPPLAKTLKIPLADLYTAAGYEAPSDLPTFTPYLRSKYKGLPSEAQAEIGAAFERIVAEYGYKPGSAGPNPGEDEQT